MYKTVFPQQDRKNLSHVIIRASWVIKFCLPGDPAQAISISIMFIMINIDDRDLAE